MRSALRMRTGIVFVGLLLGWTSGAFAQDVTSTARGPVVRAPGGSIDSGIAGGSDIAVFGDNCINSMIGGTLVTDADLATPGFLDDFSALVVTRDGSGFGVGLSSAAAANVIAYATGGNVALFPGDWADMVVTDACALGDPEDANVERAILNAVAFAALSGHGYVGEFNGTAMAVTTNADGFNPLDLIPGDAGLLEVFDDAVDIVTVLDPAHPVAAGLPGVFSPLEEFAFRTAVSGVPAENVVAEWADGFPAIIATSCDQGVCDCLAAVTLDRQQVEPGGTLSFTAKIVHWGERVVTRPLWIAVIAADGRAISRRETPEHTLRRGESLVYRDRLTLPRDLPAGDYLLAIGISGMQQGRAAASVRFRVQR